MNEDEAYVEMMKAFNKSKDGSDQGDPDPFDEWALISPQDESSLKKIGQLICFFSFLFIQLVSRLIGKLDHYQIMNEFLIFLIQVFVYVFMN
jgi:hypothetical protein